VLQFAQVGHVLDQFDTDLPFDQGGVTQYRVGVVGGIEVAPCLGASAPHRAASHADALVTSPGAGAGTPPAAQSGWNAAKAATEGLPNFGFVADQAAPASAPSPKLRRSACR